MQLSGEAALARCWNPLLTAKLEFFLATTDCRFSLILNRLCCFFLKVIRPSGLTSQTGGGSKPRMHAGIRAEEPQTERLRS